MLKNAITITVIYFLVATSLTGCAALGLSTKGSKSKVDFACVLNDERLGAPFTDPARAREWLRETAAFLLRTKQRIEAKEWTPSRDDLVRLADLADLVRRADSCLEK